MTPQKLKRTIRISTIIVTLFILCAIVIITYQVIKINTLNKQIAELDLRSASLTKQAEQLEHGIEVRKTAGFIDQEAREQYGLSKDGDIIYIQK